MSNKNLKRCLSSPEIPSIPVRKDPHIDSSFDSSSALYSLNSTLLNNSSLNSTATTVVPPNISSIMNESLDQNMASIDFVDMISIEVS